MPIKLRNTSIITSQLFLPSLFFLQSSISKELGYVVALHLKVQGAILEREMEGTHLSASSLSVLESRFRDLLFPLLY